VRIHALASTRQYLRHVNAIWKHIDPSLRGELLTHRNANTKRLPAHDVVMVGGYYDISAVPFQRIIYVEHGAGQSYGGDPRSARHPCYHGSHHPVRVIGYVSPNQRVADSWQRPAYAAGAPALDEIPVRPTRLVSKKVAAITFHFEARGAYIAPEARSARDHYEEMLHSMVAALRTDGFDVLGTWHPRDPVGHRIWRNLQVDATSDPDEVLRRATLMIADNTSLLYEAAYCGIPSIVLNAPWYRRDVEHGLRFWDHVPGLQVNDAYEFASTGFTYYCNGMDAHRTAHSAALHVYGRRRFDAGEQAARWVEKLALGDV
jgi:hypothetical protein